MASGLRWTPEQLEATQKRMRAVAPKLGDMLQAQDLGPVEWQELKRRNGVAPGVGSGKRSGRARK